MMRGLGKSSLLLMGSTHYPQTGSSSDCKNMKVFLALRTSKAG